MAENRITREVETREATTRRKKWQRPEKLPAPTPTEGYAYRWIRVATNGQSDPTNISFKRNEGWEPVKAKDHPEIHLMNPENEAFKDNVVIGGLMLCRAPQEMVDERTDYYRQHSKAQMESVDNNFMRENDPRMPLFRSRKTKVSFGSGS